VSRISPRAILFIATENDAVTPEDQTFRLYEKAGQPKKLILQKETSHYKAYADYFDQVTPQMPGGLRVQDFTPRNPIHRY